MVVIQELYGTNICVSCLIPKHIRAESHHVGHSLQSCTVGSRDPVSRLSRKLIMSAEKLFLVLTESLVRLSEHLLPSISVFLAVFNEAAIPLHQPGSVVKNCKNIRISFTQTHKEKKGASALMPRRSFFHFTSAPGGTNSL
jgi:hypothetical protein